MDKKLPQFSQCHLFLSHKKIQRKISIDDDDDNNNNNKLLDTGIIFVALMKQHVLQDKLLSFQWLGVIYNVVSVFLVGATAILNEADAVDDNDTSTTTKTTGQALWGVLFVMAGAIVQSMQLVFEEKVMTMVRIIFQKKNCLACFSLETHKNLRHGLLTKNRLVIVF